jgi:hypothetical protein
LPPDSGGLEQRHDGFSIFLTSAEEQPSETVMTFLLWNDSSATMKVRVSGIEVRQGDRVLPRLTDTDSDRFLGLMVDRELRPDARTSARLRFAPADLSGPPLKIVWRGVSGGVPARTLADFTWEIPQPRGGG